MQLADDAASMPWAISKGQLVEALQDAEPGKPYGAVYFQFTHEQWIHLRFCSNYKVHGWVHDRLTRILLFNAFVANREFPVEEDIFAAVHVRRRLLQRLPDEILDVVARFVVEVTSFRNFDDLSSWTEEERGLSVIFVDPPCLYWLQPDRFPQYYTRFPRHLDAFLLDPLRYFPDSRDILSLPLIRLQSESTSSQSILRGVEVDLSSCVCGECEQIHTQKEQSLQGFSKQYFDIIQAARERKCHAFEDAWEPILRAAEDWLDALMEHIESPDAPLPWTNTIRPGPAVCEIAEKVQLHIGSELTMDQMLRFTFLLAQIEVIQPEPDLFPECLGYGVPQHPSGKRVYARSGWLYDLPGPSSADKHDTVTFICERDDFIIDMHRPERIDPFAFTMEIPKTDMPSRFPPHHERGTSALPFSDDPSFQDLDLDMKTCLILSGNWISHGFIRPDGRYTALLRCFCLGRTIETTRRPFVEAGQSCEHTASHRVMTHCAPSCVEILLKVQEPDEELLATPRLPDMHGKQLEKYQQCLRPVIGPHSVFERDRVCIVRCSPTEGPPDPIVALAGAAGKKVYIIHRRYVVF